MNSPSLPPRNQSIVLISALVLALALSASFIFTQRASTTNVGQDTQGNQATSPSQKEMGIGVPKHIPIKIKVKNLNNEKWANDLEIEVTNKSDKPIYYLSLLVIPQSENVADEDVAFWLHYGRPQLNNFSTPLESTDEPLLPNETCVLKIPESSADGWEAARAKHNKPQPKKVGLVFQVLNFGDGTGYMDTHGTPVDKHKRASLDQGCLSPPGQDQVRVPFLPAVFLPVNFFSSNGLGELLMTTIFNPLTCCESGCKKWESSVYTCQRVCDPNHSEFVFYQELPCDSGEPCKKVQQHYDRCYYEETELACSVYEIFPCCEQCGAEGEGDTCHDGFDNDGDGFTDCAEPSCTIQSYLLTENCENGIDDNCNGKIDCYDSDCGSDARCINRDGCTPNQVDACAQVQAFCYAGFCYTPILMDLQGDGYQLTNPQGGVQFDMGGGQRYQIAWTTANSDDAWLALDRNGNGQVDSGKELFGNVTDQPPTIEPQGFLALAVFDAASKGGNEDGRIDSRDAVFNALRLWQDVNHNGVSEPSELQTLQSQNVAAIDLAFKESRKTDEFGNRFRYRSKVYDQHGASVGRWAWDVFLKLAP